MLRGIHSRLSYANVMSTLGVFIALGGVGYAAVQLPTNSVGPAQIKKNAVTGSKVRNSSLTGADVRNGSLTAKDFSGSVQGAQGSAGPKGEQGPAGPKGEQGPAGPELTVRDAAGTVVGSLVLQEGGSSISVRRDGGIYVYQPSGLLIPVGNPQYLTNTCTGTAFVFASSVRGTLEQVGQTIGSSVRIVSRAFLTGGGLGPALAWKGSGVAAEYVSQAVYYVHHMTGVCTANGSFTGKLVRLDPVTPPPDFSGPLTVG